MFSKDSLGQETLAIWRDGRRELSSGLEKYRYSPLAWIETGRRSSRPKRLCQERPKFQFGSLPFVLGWRPVRDPDYCPSANQPASLWCHGKTVWNGDKNSSISETERFQIMEKIFIHATMSPRWREKRNPPNGTPRRQLPLTVVAVLLAADVSAGTVRHAMKCRWAQ